MRFTGGFVLFANTFAENRLSAMIAAKILGSGLDTFSHESDRKRPASEDSGSGAFVVSGIDQ